MDIVANKEITEEEYKEILLNMMDSIDSFCRKHQLKYYMLGGTMLGAVRHKGFIPWDDDIDIGMLRKDYDFFCKNYNGNGNFYYKVISLGNNHKYYFPAAKVIDSRTVLIENVNQAIDIGAYIDVFPLDYVEPNSEGKFKFFCEEKMRRFFENMKKLRVSRKRSIWKNFIVLFAHVICRKSVHEIAVMEERRAIENSSLTVTKWIANYHGAWKEKEIMNSSIFSESVEYTFCGRKYFGVKKYDEYLNNLYGDYMILPPENKRVTHHDYVVKWKNN